MSEVTFSPFTFVSWDEVAGSGITTSVKVGYVTAAEIWTAGVIFSGVTELPGNFFLPTAYARMIGSLWPLQPNYLWTYEMRYVNESNPADFNLTNRRPGQGDLDEVSLGQFTIGNTGSPDFNPAYTLTSFNLLLPAAIVMSEIMPANRNRFGLVLKFISNDVGTGADAIGGPILAVDTRGEGSSVSDRRRGVKWFTCPRCGFEFPITEAVRDGERRDLWVDADCADKVGRRDTRRRREERGDRMWPRL